MDTSGYVVIPPLDVVFPPHTFWAIEPQIAVDIGNHLHVVWIDGRTDTVARIYHKRGENEPGIEETNQSPALKLLNITVLPNPFTYRTRIRCSILDTRYMTNKNALDIYDATGRLVKSYNLESGIENQELDVLWDGKDLLGHNLAGGIYFLTFSSGNYSATEKLLLIR